jgi:energy-converting hydrogenase A subunit M
MSGGNLILTIQAPSGEPGSGKMRTVYRRKLKTKSVFRYGAPELVDLRSMFKILRDELEMEGYRLLHSMVEAAKRGME